MSKPRGGLGRGLGALIPTGPAAPPAQSAPAAEAPAVPVDGAVPAATP